ncbi:MAG TPA: PHP domain-containing protein [Dehalococcoidia bacterium]|nr:PHP domain-containing protein [Dehalococcoidia bacterium]
MFKADLHIHTEYSIDSSNKLEGVIERCLELGINCIATCDHGTTEGAIKLRDIAPFMVIVAEEVLTPEGEIMGMFLKETIPSGISVDETISRIREQNGLVCIPHPFDIFRPSALKSKALNKIADRIDMIEVFNARTLPYQNMSRPQNFAIKHNLPQSAGSDAHTLSEIGKAYVEMPEFDGRDDFIESLVQGKIYGSRTNPLIHFLSLGNRIRKKLGNR